MIAVYNNYLFTQEKVLSQESSNLASVHKVLLQLMDQLTLKLQYHKCQYL